MDPDRLIENYDLGSNSEEKEALKNFIITYSNHKKSVESLVRRIELTGGLALTDRNRKDPTKNIGPMYNTNEKRWDYARTREIVPATNQLDA